MAPMSRARGRPSCSGCVIMSNHGALALKFWLLVRKVSLWNPPLVCLSLPHHFIWYHLSHHLMLHFSSIKFFFFFFFLGHNLPSRFSILFHSPTWRLSRWLSGCCCNNCFIIQYHQLLTTKSHMHFNEYSFTLYLLGSTTKIPLQTLLH